MNSTFANRLSIAIAIGGALTFPSASQAADLPSRKTPPPVAIEQPSAIVWTGFYIGGVAGGSFANAAQGYSISSPTLAAYPPIIPAIDAAGSHNLRPQGFEGGLEVGYDWRVSSSYILGVAGDLNLGGLRGSLATNGDIPINGIPYTVTQGLNSDWRTTLRLRAGVTPVDNLLVYATGGAAFAHFNYSQAFWDSVNETESVSFHALRAGWTVGTGAEWAFSRHWSLKGEYRFSQYSAVTGEGSSLLTDGTTAYVAHSSGLIRENSLLMGLDYHID